MSKNNKISLFSEAVRNSTIKRLQAVPVGYENWSISVNAMSFGDLTQHLIDTDHWLFKKLEIKTLEPIVGNVNLVHIENRDQYMELISQLIETGNERIELIEKLTDNQLNEQIFDRRFGKEVSVWWIIMRGNIDHEIHHRGQIAAYLRALNDTLHSD